MKFRHNETGHIFNGEYELRMAHPTVSFPPVFDQNALEFANVSMVVEVQPPDCTPLQRVDFDGIQLIDGYWTETWSIHDKYDNPVEQAAWIEVYTNSQWNVVRDERDRLLRETDYTDLPNTPITTQCRNNFLTYRQALRDITNQTDAFNIVWPTKPVYEPQT